MRLATIFKRAALVTTTVGFGIFAGLVARHNGNLSVSQPSSSVSSGQMAAPASQNNGSANDLFNAQGQSGYGFGVSGGQSPVTSTSAS